MPSHPASSERRFVPEEPIRSEGKVFFDQVTEISDRRPGGQASAEVSPAGWDGFLEEIAAELYRIGSMLVGEGEEAIGLIEQVVADGNLPGCCDQAEARHKGRLLLAADAIRLLRGRDAAAHTVSLAVPEADSGPASCIEDDDLEAAGVSSADLEQMISGPESHRLREWLEGLSTPLRVIFVLRAVAGLSSAEVAGLLAGEGDPAWTPDAVRSSFRQALCSLASQLIHATASR